MQIQPTEPLALLSITTEGVTKALADNACLLFQVTEPLTADEIEFLFAIREDEKVMQDLTLSFSGKYPVSKPFVNISQAEATHIITIERVFTYYEIEFPSQTATGVFADDVRQNYYNGLLAQGNVLIEAYRAAGNAEEQNVAAYKTVLPNIANVNIKLVVENMLRASSNHLKAYLRQITLLGGSYIPATLDKPTFDEIINSEFKQGGKYGQCGGTGTGNNNTNSGKGGKGQGKKGSVNDTGNCTNTVNGGAGGGYHGGK